MSESWRQDAYEERLRERFEQIRDMALDGLEMLDAQAQRSSAVYAKPGEPSWLLDQIAAEVAEAQAIAAEHRPDDDDADDS